MDNEYCNQCEIWHSKGQHRENPTAQAIEKILAQGRQSGRKVVVDWIEKHSDTKYSYFTQMTFFQTVHFFRLYNNGFLEAVCKAVLFKYYRNRVTLKGRRSLGV